MTNNEKLNRLMIENPLMDIIHVDDDLGIRVDSYAFIDNEYVSLVVYSQYMRECLWGERRFAKIKDLEQRGKRVDRAMEKELSKHEWAVAILIGVW